MTFKKIRIVTDSVSDIPPDLLEQWQIAVIPCFVNYGGNSYADDGVELNRSEFYQQVASMSEFPTTAAPPPAMAEAILQDALESYDHLICIHVPAKLSQTINNVRLGAASLPADKVTIIDSGTLSMGIGTMVLMAAEIAQQTGDVEQVVSALERVRDHVQVYAAFATMDFLRRSGRVNNLVAVVGSLLQIKPIVAVRDGVVEPEHRVRTFGRAVAKLREMVDEQMPLYRLTVLHIANHAGAQAFLDELGDKAPPGTRIVEVGPTLGTHIGPGSVGAVTLSRNWNA